MAVYCLNTFDLVSALVRFQVGCVSGRLSTTVPVMEQSMGTTRQVCIGGPLSDLSHLGGYRVAFGNA
jgi:hypothetical protein